MVIKRRKNVPDPEEFIEKNEDTRKTGRNPSLNGLRLDIYNFILTNSGCTRRDVAKGLKLPNNVATARIKELIDEGLVFEPGGRKRNSSGVRAKTLEVTGAKQGSKTFEKVKVHIEVGTDPKGEYCANAYVAGTIGGYVDGMTILLRKTITVHLPKRTKSRKKQQKSAFSRVDSGLGGFGGGPIIEGEYTVVKRG